MKILLALLLVVALPAVVEAQGLPQLAPGETLVSMNGVPAQQGATSYYRAPVAQTSHYSAPAAPTRRGSLAQSKANRMANNGVMQHLGGGFGAGGRYEGVGMASTREGAIRNCCYWGRRTPVDIGAATNGRRWFACVIYR